MKETEREIEKKGEGRRYEGKKRTWKVRGRKRYEERGRKQNGMKGNGREGVKEQ